MQQQTVEISSNYGLIPALPLMCMGDEFKDNPVPKPKKKKPAAKKKAPAKKAPAKKKKK